MACTTVLVGRKATNNGSTIIARNDDDANGVFTVKRFAVVLPEEQPDVYESVLSHVRIPLPQDALRYTAVPNADPKKSGIWAAAGINEANVAMSATETITTNPRVLAADPLVEYVEGSQSDPKSSGGIGEEDLVVLVLPYIRSAREGVRRLGELLEQYGTYENNGIAFSDRDEVWYMETIGGHHWIARRLPDDCYAVLPNQFTEDLFDLEDACTRQKNYMSSLDLKQFVEENHLDLSSGAFNARLAFGSHSDSDHVYNTPRMWFGQRFFNPSDPAFDSMNLISGPQSDLLPWCRKPDHKITVEEVRYVLSSTYQGTPWSVYSRSPEAGLFRPIGINRTAFCSLAEIRRDVPEEICAVEWISFGSNVYTAFVPLYTNITRAPEYFSRTPAQVSTDSFYWASRLICALADPYHDACLAAIERYQQAVDAKGRQILLESERNFEIGEDGAEFCNRTNEKISRMVRAQTDLLLDQVLFTASSRMHNGYSRSDN